MRGRGGRHLAAPPILRGLARAPPRAAGRVVPRGDVGPVRRDGPRGGGLLAHGPPRDRGAGPSGLRLPDPPWDERVGGDPFVGLRGPQGSELLRDDRVEVVDLGGPLRLVPHGGLCGPPRGGRRVGGPRRGAPPPPYTGGPLCRRPLFLFSYIYLNRRGSRRAS